MVILNCFLVFVNYMFGPFELHNGLGIT